MDYKADLSKTAIGIKTFLRDHLLYNTIQAIRYTLPECQMLIADDGEMTEEKDGIYADLIREGHKVIILPFDSGFGAKANAIARALERPYLLIGSDDFDFRPKEVREGIERLQEVLDLVPEVDIASGRVNGVPYEYDLLDRGAVVTEIPLIRTIEPSPWYVDCDLTVNYNLVRSVIFGLVMWDEGEDAPKIGGAEHGSWSLDCKRAGLKTVFVPGVHISEQEERGDARYMKYRARAKNAGRPCFDKRGVKKYILGNGRIDYDATANRN